MNKIYIRRNLGIFTPTQYCAGGKIEKNEICWACGAYGRGDRYAQRCSSVTRAKKPLGRPRRRWENNIKTDLQEVGSWRLDGVGSG